jgi:hypothetical protein
MYRMDRIETRRTKSAKAEWVWRRSSEAAQECVAELIAKRHRRKKPKAKDIKEARDLVNKAETKGNAELFGGRVRVWCRTY